MDDRWFFYAVALLSAASWALGSILWRKLGEEISPVAMNLSKGLLGSLFLGVCLPWMPSAPVAPRSLLFLGVSGVIGIAVGDTFFFKALMHLGPRLTSLLGTLYPVSIALAATVVLGERPSSTAWFGISLTTVGVAWVLWERAPGGVGDGKRRTAGFCYASLAIISTTAAVLLAKVGVAAVPPMEAALVRLLSGTLGLLSWGYATGGLTGWVAPLRRGRVLGRVVFVVLIVVFGGFWLSLVALKNIDASVAGTLNATGPLFMLPLSRVLLQERVSARSFLGTVLSIAGVGAIFMG